VIDVSDDGEIADVRDVGHRGLQRSDRGV